MSVSETMTVALQQVGAESILGILFVILLIIATIGGQWAVLNKAGRPGWAALVPVYNIYVMLHVADRAWWWLVVILFVPILNLVGIYLLFVGVSKAFGNGTGFGLGLLFLPFVFWPLLGFGDYDYQGVTQ